MFWPLVFESGEVCFANMIHILVNKPTFLL